MNGRRVFSMLGVAILLGGCFHQTVQTGRAPSPNVVEKEMTATWLWGLVPAQPIDVRRECPSGVATIETQQSFLNGFVSALTLGIYAPQNVRITCATSTARLPEGAYQLVIPANATADEVQRILDVAVRHAVDTDSATILRF